jgi:lysyl-tRNA synthetase class I
MTKPKQEEYSLEGLEILNDIPKKTPKKRTLKEVIRTIQLPIRLTKEERETIQKSADERGLTVTKYIRKCALSGVTFSSTEQKKEETEDKDYTKRSLISIANNLNQLTKYSHQTGIYNKEIPALIAKIQNIIER